MKFPEIERIGVTIHNIDKWLPKIIIAVTGADLIGLDIETEDSDRHQGLNDYMAGAGRKLVFDVNRTTVCGVSLWVDGCPHAWYFNLAHADVENRIPWEILEHILVKKPTHCKWVVHNANFERTMFAKSLGWEMQDYIDTLIMAVSAYNADEYDLEVFNAQPLGALANHIPEIISACRSRVETDDVKELMGKIIGKDSGAEHSYNGWVSEFCYGYGLKKAVKSWFGYQMRTFEETLAGREHMGQLTTEEVSYYGCDDAIWCVRLYHRLLQFMMETNPSVIPTYFEQELPMVEVYSETWREGVRIDSARVEAKQLDIRAQYATTTVHLKEAIRKLLPFPAEPNAKLAEHDDWYAKNWKKYRAKIAAWANSPDNPDPFLQATQLSGAIPNAWYIEKGLPKITAKQKDAQLNLTHYMPMRVLMYDLFRQDKLIVSKGKTQSDAWARGRLKERLVKHGDNDAATVMTMVGETATIEQVSKLYITPYRKLIDPDTSRMYPVLSSELNTRRTSMQLPNAQQLSKRNPDTTYVRGFYIADYDDHVIVSIDWSQIELVLIGEASGDPYFEECYGQLPYNDLHRIACADCLEVELQEFLDLKLGDGFIEKYGADHKLLLNPKGEIMPPAKAFGYWRTEVGKGSNFSYWYSGALNQVGERLGWTSEEMFAASDRYRNKFSVGEAWRINEIRKLQDVGYLKLPDGHRRTRYEATPEWARGFRQKWLRYDMNNDNGVMWFIDKVIRRLQSRANNQGINALIQGTCATLAKRSIPAVNRKMKALGWGPREARFMLPVHDELVYSVHRDLAPQFIQLASATMNNHPEIISRLVMDCSPSVGLTFEPWHATKARTGQIELREAPELDIIKKEEVGKEIPFDRWSEVVDWLFHERNK